MLSLCTQMMTAEVDVTHQNAYRQQWKTEQTDNNGKTELTDNDGKTEHRSLLI